MADKLQAFGFQAGALGPDHIQGRLAALFLIAKAGSDFVPARQILAGLLPGRISCLDLVNTLEQSLVRWLQISEFWRDAVLGLLILLAVRLFVPPMLIDDLDQVPRIQSNSHPQAFSTAVSRRVPDGFTRGKK